MKKNSRTKEQMYPLIEGFSTSGMTSRAYARSLGMKYGTYKYWVRKYKADPQKDFTKRKQSGNHILYSLSCEYSFTV